MIGLREQTAMGDLSYGSARAYDETLMRRFINRCWSHGIWVEQVFDIRTDYLRLAFNRGGERYSIRIPSWVACRMVLPELLDKLRKILSQLFKIEEW